MELLSFLKQYFFWHYTTALKEIFGIAENFLWFLYHFFSIPILLRSFFSPWRRMRETYRKGFYLGDFFEKLAINIIMRIVGIIIRTGTLVVGFLALAAALFISIVIFVAWLVLPFLVVLLFYQGIIDFIR